MTTNLQKTLILITSFTAILGLLFTQNQNLDSFNIAPEKVGKKEVISSNSRTNSVKNTSSFNANPKPAIPSKESFAVVELFTSQGCSSCPPADRVLRDIIDEAAKTGKQVYGLSFHVDYWNYLGWKDPYSHADYSNRQRYYNQRLKSRGSYTPQMIVNGVSEFVGSKRKYANQEVSYALETPAKVEIAITNLQLDKNKNQVEVEYQITGDCKNCKVNIAAVESNLNDAVKRGENHGRTLQHDNVVRAFKTKSFEASDKMKIHLPNG
ncbi:MAG: DUF1223 domain-containing protein, partial [Chitinophagales bacterium]